MDTAAGIKVEPTDASEAGSGANSRGLTVYLSKIPPWYREKAMRQHENAERSFVCENYHSLYRDVYDLMATESSKLLDDPTVKRKWQIKDSNLKKMIRRQVLSKGDKLSQKPTPELVAALMDVAEIERGTTLRCFSDTRLVDRAGIKHYLLMSQNYVLFYLPTENRPKGTKPIIPVVTYYKDKGNMCYVDKNTSRIGTYVVPLGPFGVGDKPSFFIQEVLSLPDPESLKVLRGAVDHRFEFWDLSLEVPTHSTALTPTFTHVQLAELIGQEEPRYIDKTVKPMLCLNDGPRDLADSKRLWFDVTELRPGVLIDNFLTAEQEQGTPGLLFKRVLRSRNWLMATIPLKLPTESASLDASTTARFLNALEHTSVMGTGELPSWHKLVLLDLVQTSNFLAPPESYDNMYACVLRHYIQRVNLGSSTGFVMPGHIDCQISDPRRNEIVALGIRLLSNDIPRPFAISEILCGSDIDAQHYVIWCETMASNNNLALAAKRRNRLKLDTRMSKNWNALRTEANKYCAAMMNWAHNYHKGGWLYYEFLTNDWDALFGTSAQTPENALRAASMWEDLDKKAHWDLGNWGKQVAEDGGSAEEDAAAAHEGKNTKPGSKKPKGIANLVTKKVRDILDTAKLLMCRLKEDHSIIAKSYRKTMGSVERQQANASKDVDAKLDHMLKKFLPPLTHQANGGNLASLAWLKNLNHLLLEPNWIYSDRVQKDAVCMMLDMTNTILATKNAIRFEEWVRNNLITVKTYLELVKPNTKDTLSTALKDSYNSVCSSLATWCEPLASNRRAQAYWQAGPGSSARVRLQKDHKPLAKKARLAPAPLTRRSRAKTKMVGKELTKKALKDKAHKAKGRTKTKCSDFSNYESEELCSVTEESEEDQAHKVQARKARKRTRSECDAEGRATSPVSDLSEEEQPRKAKMCKARQRTITFGQCPSANDCDDTWSMSEEESHVDRGDECSAYDTSYDDNRSMSADQKLSSASGSDEDDDFQPSKSSRNLAKVSSRNVSAGTKSDWSSEPRKRTAKSRHCKDKTNRRQVATSPHSEALWEPEDNLDKTLRCSETDFQDESAVDDMPDSNIIQL